MIQILSVSLAVTAAYPAAAPPDTTGFDAFREAFLPGATGTLQSPRARRYIARFDREVADRVKAFDFDKGLLDLTGPMPPPALADLEPEARKPHAENGKYGWLYSLSRGSAEAIGAFALAWALPGSEHFGDERLRRGAVRGIEAYLAHQAPTGEFVFCSIRFSSVYQTHEMAWRLEPLLAAYLCVRHTLPPEQAKRFHDGLQRAADYLYNTPCTSQSNRGCIWCGVTAVAARVFDRPDYLDRVREVWSWVGRRVFHRSGQVIEGPGPDFVYSYESFRYTFLHRLAADNASLDAPLIRALDWFITMHDSDGLPMQSVSTRLSNDSPRRLADLLGALEYFAGRRPYYAALAERYLGRLEREPGVVATRHAGILWVAAALYHDAGMTAAPLPERLRRFASVHSFDVTHYLKVRRDYDTLVLFSGVKDASGLQHWCLAGERPMLLPFPGGTSTLLAWATDTARIRLPGGSWRTDTTDLTTASVNWGRLRTCYVFGESSTWVFNVAPGLRRELRWAMHGKRCPTPVLAGRTIRALGQTSRMDVGPVAPSLAETGGGRFVQVTLPENVPIDWTVFHDGRAGPVTTKLREGLLTAQLHAGAARYQLYFNAGTGSTRAGDVELAPLQARVQRLGPRRGGAGDPPHGNADR